MGWINFTGLSSGKDMLRFSDRLNSRYTVVLLVCLATGLAVAQLFAGEPIACFVPAHFTDAHHFYANKVRNGKANYSGF